MDFKLEALLGSTLDSGRYRVDAKLGEGGMGYVLRAHDVRLGTDVVIKLPRPAMLEDPEFAERFSREVRALVRLVHPHIVRITDVGIHEGWPFAVMQYLPGGSLEDQLHDVGWPSRSVLQQLRWLPDIARALDYVHQQGYVHRDVKPANVLFDPQGHAFLGDFGVTKVVSANTETHETALTGRGLVLGTPDYMAPELVLGDPFDGRVDQYALAITVYEVLTGRRPFQASSVMALLVKHTREAPPDLGTLRPDLPAALVQMVHRGLAKAPESRFPDCITMAREILRAVSAAPAGAPPSPKTQPVAAPIPAGVGAGGTIAMSGPLASGPVRLPCPSCQTVLTLTDAVRGRHVRCPSCQSKFKVASGLDALMPPDGAGTQSTTTLPVMGSTLPSLTRPEVAPRPRPTPPVAATRVEVIPTPPPSLFVPAETAAPSWRMPLLLAGTLAAGVAVLGLSYAMLFGGRGTSADGPPPLLAEGPAPSAPRPAAEPPALVAARQAMAEGQFDEAESLLAVDAADATMQSLLLQLNRTARPAVRADLDRLSDAQLDAIAGGGRIAIPGAVQEPALRERYLQVARGLLVEIQTARAPEPESEPEPEPEPAPKPTTIAMRDGLPTLAAENVSNEPPPLEALSGVSLAELLERPTDYVDKIIEPHVGYLEITERPRRRADGTYTARLTAYMDRSSKTLPALEQQPADGLNLLFDASMGAYLVSVWDGPARELRPLKCAPRIALRRAGETAPNAVVGLIPSVEIFIESPTFRGLYGYDLRALGPVVNALPQLKDEVMVARLDEHGVSVESVPGIDWERRVGSSTTDTLRTAMKNRMRQSVGARNMMSLQQAAHQGLINGIVSGAAREQQFQNLKSQFLNLR